MTSNLEKYKKDLEKLIDKGEKLSTAMQYECYPDGVNEAAKTDENLAKVIKSLPKFNDEYQAWYSEAKVLIKQLLPDRIDDFTRHYEKPKTRKDISYENYRIEDYLQGLTITSGYEKRKIVGPDGAIPHFKQQQAILNAVLARFESSLFDIKQLVQADLFDSELDTARELIKHGFLRGAGAISGVVLEKHLAQVVINHNVKTHKKAPTINDFNEILKNEGILDVPSWRQIQRLGDIRNLCDHNKEREPTKEEVEELVAGVAKFTKTLY
ncbi:MAG: hypothetical protein M0P91_06430 [Sulfuricurvum sp.]|jgi:hypothetical protein|uniref:hypothetical protein n=1 Tax=Sulfuricurvum sp. TaxID=2025608 RepID=UPI0025D85958|nr:hypothetical protein [Sulfuricurvum sp.]MCK9372815.1 hypothetical protein [Sulfuricurvum sp.]